jgi:hypothetical protein
MMMQITQITSVVLSTLSQNIPPCTSSFAADEIP